MKALSSEQIEQIRRLTDYRDDFDAIVAFGYGPVQCSSRCTSCRLNLYGRLNAIAAGMLYQSLAIGRIIPTGGKTGGNDKPSEAELMARIIQSKFGVSKSAFLLEEEAMDTMFNAVYIANIIDQSPQLYQNLLFVALGFHLPRIQEICSLINLNGFFVAAEAVVKLRSERHKHLLRKLLHPDNASYAMMLENQARGIRGLRTLPEYWIPPLGRLKHPQRLREVLATERSQSFLDNHCINTTSLSAEQLQQTIGSIPRQYPD